MRDNYFICLRKDKIQFDNRRFFLTCMLDIVR